jgi:hypothetical protein
MTRASIHRRPRCRARRCTERGRFALSNDALEGLLTGRNLGQFSVVHEVKV